MDHSITTWAILLHENAIDGGIIIELIDQGEQVLLACIARQVMGDRVETHLLAILALVRYVDLGGGVAAYQDHGKAGCAKPLCAAFGNTTGDLLANVGSNRFTVDQFCGHDAWLTIGEDLERARILACRGDVAKAKQRPAPVTPLSN